MSSVQPSILPDLLKAIRKVYDDVGPPGHFGYSTREGKALKQLYDLFNQFLKVGCELLIWTPATVLPDSDTTVLVQVDDEDQSVWPGYWDDAVGEWRHAEGMPLAFPVIAWSHMPTGMVTL